LLLFASFLPFFERGAEAIETPFPQLAVLREPFIQLAEAFRFERIETPLPIRPHRDKAGFQEDAQVAGNAGLVDPDILYDVVDLPFALPQGFDNAAASRVGENLKGIYLHYHAYTLSRM
jgi:hypothetical protein